MHRLKQLILDIEETSQDLKDASEYMKRLEKEVEYKDKSYREAQKVLLALYMKGKADPVFMEQIPEVLEYMKEAGDHDTV